MKFRITMKCPDAGSEEIQKAAERTVELNSKVIEDPLEEMLEDERLWAVHEEKERLIGFVGQWMRYGEYIDLEFDTKAGTCTVLKSK